MPKDALQSLSKARLKKLIDQSYFVFAKHSYHKTSINDLTSELAITRTAFYYYFYNKEDLYTYLIQLEKENFINNYIYDCNEKLSLEEIFVNLFDYLALKKNTYMQDFYLDLFNHISLISQNNLLDKLLIHHEYSHFIGYDCYNLQNETLCKEISLILFSIVTRQIVSYYEQDGSIDDAKCELLQKIDLIKKGIQK